MGFLLVLAMIVGLLLLIGFKLGDILFLAVIGLGVLTALIGLFFLASLFALIFSKRVHGKFVRFNEEERFPSAVYRILDFEDKEIENIFPGDVSNNSIKKKFYVPEKEITLLYNKPTKSIVDKNALITIIAGAAFFIPAGAAAVIMLIGNFTA